MLEDIGNWRPEDWELIKQWMGWDMGIVPFTHTEIIEQTATAILRAYDVSDEFRERAKMEMEG